MGSAPVGSLLHGLSSRRCPMSTHFLTWWISRLLGLAILSWAFARVGVHCLSLRLLCLGVFPLSLLRLTLNFIRDSALRQMYLHPSVDPSLTRCFGEFPGLGLTLVPDVVVPEADHGCAWSRNLVSNFCPGRGLKRGPYRLMTVNVTTRLRCAP